MKEDDEITFDEAKRQYSQLNSSNLSIKMTRNKNDETNLKVGYPNLRSRRARLNNNNKLTLNMDDNDSDFTNSFSNLLVDKLSESEKKYVMGQQLRISVILIQYQYKGFVFI